MSFIALNNLCLLLAVNLDSEILDLGEEAIPSVLGGARAERFQRKGLLSPLNVGEMDLLKQSLNDFSTFYLALQPIAERYSLSLSIDFVVWVVLDTETVDKPKIVHNAGLHLDLYNYYL